LALYKEFYDSLRVPVILSRRPDWDKFPGADYTIAVDTIMPDGKTLQIGTVHMLGDHFSRTYNITYEDANGEQQYAYQTCYGISERSIASVISIHGDDKGLVLPPEVAPLEIVVVPIIVGKRRDEVLASAAALEAELRDAGFAVRLDARDMRPGAKYYHWEMRGVPLRIEVGPRDIDANTVVAVTRTGKKTTLDRRGVVEGITSVLREFGEELLQAARQAMAEKITVTETLEATAEAVKTGVAVVHWCGSQECAEKVEAAVGASIIGSEIRSDLIAVSDGPCIACGGNGTSALVARTY
ncbi:MAG: prolyl-tRNA synthetase, partial [Euryarchaeota archaeon]|nr:prolyl-tRNA synthetase [Euryarchaeota archaeon]